MYIYIYIYGILYITYTVEKKENNPIILGAVKMHY